MFSFCWKTSGLDTLSESTASTEYSCPNGKRWRGIRSIEGGQLHLLSLVGVFCDTSNSWSKVRQTLNSEKI